MPRLQRIAFGKDTDVTSGSRSPSAASDKAGFSSSAQRPRSKSEPTREEIRRKPVTTPGSSPSTQQRSSQSTPDATDDDEFIYDDEDEDEVIESGDNVVPNSSDDGYKVSNARGGEATFLATSTTTTQTPQASGRSGSLVATNSLRQIRQQSSGSSISTGAGRGHQVLARTSSFNMYNNNNNTDTLDMFGASPSNSNNNASPALTAKQQPSVQFGTALPMAGPATLNLIDDFPIRPSQSQPTSSNPCMYLNIQC